LPENASRRYHIIARKKPTFYFIGVTTGQSSIMKIFPLWVKAIGHPDAVIQGVDLKLHDDAEAYRQAVAQIKYDPNSWGALITSHKISLYDAARDMFDYLDPYAHICGEVSSISKRNGSLEGHAKDPISAGLSLDAILGENYFGRTGGEVLCLGPGGSATAIALHLINKHNPGDQPRRFVVVGRTRGRLDRLEKMLQGLQTDIKFEFFCHEDPERNDALMAGMPDGSLVINATGMGKDLPGSPITDKGLFPMNGIAWELNYRGELDFLHQALAQSETRHVRVEDGWLYFLHGWTQGISQVFHQDITSEQFERLAAIAEEVIR
jgi:shikimate dehydrogenase